jgi:hypothetical protein
MHLTISFYSIAPTYSSNFILIGCYTCDKRLFLKTNFSIEDDALYKITDTANRVDLESIISNFTDINYRPQQTPCYYHPHPHKLMRSTTKFRKDCVNSFIFFSRLDFFILNYQYPPLVLAIIYYFRIMVNF